MDEMTLAEFWARKRRPRVTARMISASANYTPSLEVEIVPCADGGKARRVWLPAFGKARPRVTQNGTYMPHDYQAQRDRLRLAFGDVPAGLVHLSVSVVRQMPASWSRAKRDRMRGAYASPKPDIDNILGAVMDALFQEDDRVVSVFAEKRWGDEHEILIEIAPAQ